MEKPPILLAAELPEHTVAQLKALFDVWELPKDDTARAALLREHGEKVKGLALHKIVVDEAFLSALPNLEIISSYSAGLDNVDVPAVNKRGIRLENTSHILAEDVANAAIGLALALTRNLVQADAFVRSGQWLQQPQFPLSRSIARMKVGIVGLGAIGLAVTRRLQALEAQVCYFGPHRKPIDFPYYDDLAAMARACDMLILTCPLTEATRHLVNASVLEAIGPQGYLVNIARGPVVDEAALIGALAADQIAGAALDVFEHEPQVPEALIRDERVLLTPHLGSATMETRQAMADNIVRTLADHFGLTAEVG